MRQQTTSRSRRLMALSRGPKDVDASREHGNGFEKISVYGERRVVTWDIFIYLFESKRFKKKNLFN